MVCQFRLFKDGRCCFPYASPRIAEIFRLEPHEIKTDGTKLFERIHPDDLARINAAVRESATHLTPLHEQFRIRFRDGVTTWAESRAQPERLEDGSVLWHSFVTDITHQKLIEETSAKREFLFRKMADASPVFIWMFGADGHVEYANKTMLDFLGCPLQRVLGTGWRNFVHPDDLAASYSQLLMRMEASEPFHYLVRTLRHDGVYRTTANWARPWFHDDGTLGGYIGSSIDITEQKAAQDDIIKMRDQFDSILSSLPEVVYSLSPDFNTVYFVGSATEHVYGRPAQDFINDTDLWLKVIHPNDLFKIDHFMDDLHRHGQACVEYRIIKPDGSLGWVSDKARIIRDKSGASVRVDGVIVDITSRVETDAQLRAARTAAENASRHKSEFLASMSHEIRTPMTAIVGYAHLLTSGRPTQQEQALWSGHIRRNSDYLLNLVNDILDLSKIEAGQLELQLQPIDPWNAVQNVIDLMAPRASEKLIALNISRRGETPSQITTDGTRLRQILVNIVSNAVKFTDRGSISLEMSSASDPISGNSSLVFTITDTGIGIDPAKLQQLFKPFSRVSENTTGSIRPGTGLGLAIARNFAVMLGGTITVESVPGQGSRFTVSINAGPTSQLTFIPQDNLPAPALAAPASPLTPNTLAGVRILVTDDNPDNQRIVEFMLEQAGATVELANHGCEATDRIMTPAGKPPIDLVFMDMQMPVCDGYTATRMLRSRGFTLPVIALTAFTMAGDRQKCLDAGCTSYLTKPVVPDTLVQEALRFLPRRAGTPANNAAPVRDRKPLNPMLANPRFSKLVKDYIEGLDETRQFILTNLDNADFDALRILSHRLKGSGTSYGFPEITQSAAACEAAIKSGKPVAEVTTCAHHLIAQLDSARASEI